MAGRMLLAYHYLTNKIISWQLLSHNDQTCMLLCLFPRVRKRHCDSPLKILTSQLKNSSTLWAWCTCVYVCVIHNYVCLYVWACLCFSFFLCICVYFHVYVYLHKCACVYMYVYIWIFVYVFECHCYDMTMILLQQYSPKRCKSLRTGD